VPQESTTAAATFAFPKRASVWVVVARVPLATHAPRRYADASRKAPGIGAQYDALDALRPIRDRPLVRHMLGHPA
jgi:hypothetical protein